MTVKKALFISSFLFSIASSAEAQNIEFKRVANSSDTIEVSEASGTLGGTGIGPSMGASVRFKNTAGIEIAEAAVSIGSPAVRVRMNGNLLSYRLNNKAAFGKKDDNLQIDLNPGKFSLLSTATEKDQHTNGHLLYSPDLSVRYNITELKDEGVLAHLRSGFSPLTVGIAGDSDATRAVAAAKFGLGGGLDIKTDNVSNDKDAYFELSFMIDQYLSYTKNMKDGLQTNVRVLYNWQDNKNNMNFCGITAQSDQFDMRLDGKSDSDGNSKFVGLTVGRKFAVKRNLRQKAHAAWSDFVR